MRSSLVLIRRLLYLLNPFKSSYGKIITQEGRRGNFSDNDDFRITIRWKGKVKKRFLKKENFGSRYNLRKIELTPISRNAEVSIRIYDAAAGISTEFLKLKKESKNVKILLFMKELK